MHLKSVKHVACYLSGSVDSAVAALLLRKKGYYVTGVFLENRLQNREDAERRKQKALEVSQALQMPLHQVSLSNQQWDNFLSTIVSEYEKKRIPSLDVSFTKHVLFGSLYEKVLHSTGADFVVTGHFARTTVGEHIDKWTKFQGSRLLRAMDVHEDESYNLSSLPQAVLQKAYFPLGDFNRDVVTKITETTELAPIFGDLAHKSSEIELVDPKELLSLLEKDVPDTKGTVTRLETGEQITTHDGLHLWPVGSSLRVGEKSFYVVSRDEETNEIKVVNRIDHPALYSYTFFTALAHWSHETPYNFYEKHTMDVSFRFHARQQLLKATLTVGAHNEWCGNDHIILSCSLPVWGVVPGHTTAFYQGEECIGSATILKAGPSEYAMNYHKYKSLQNARIGIRDGDSGTTVGKFFKNIFPNQKV